MNRFFVILALLGVLLMPSCRRHSEGWSRLDLADALMEQAPDSALAILEEIDPDSLLAGHERARYALLLSMALDKNYIDLDTLEVLQPAIDYYSEHGSPDERLRMRYYQGRIHANRNEFDQALQCYIQGKDFNAKITDSLTYARLLVAEGVIYRNVYLPELTKLCDAEAATIFGRMGRQQSEFNTWLKVFECGLLLEDKEFCDSVRNICDSIVSLNPQYQEDLNRLLLIYYSSYGPEEKIAQLIDSVDIENASVKLKLNVALGYAILRQNEQALALLNSVNTGQLNSSDSLKYLSVKTVVLDSAGFAEDALMAYHEFNNIAGVREMDLLDKDFFFAQRHHDTEMAKLHEQQKNYRLKWILGLCIAVIVFILLSVFYLIKYTATKRKLRETSLQFHIKQLENERERLTQLLAERKNLDVSITGLINERLKLLDKLLANRLSNNDRYVREIDSLIQNQSDFMEYIRKGMQTLYPGFILEMQQKGLTDDELNYICMYALGLNGKDLGNYINSKSNYNISSRIRKKLQLSEYDSNLSIFVQNLFNNYSEKGIF